MTTDTGLDEKALEARARRAVVALRTPDYTMTRVPNTIRQSIADVIEELLASTGPTAAECLAMEDLRAANIARDKEWNTGSERVSLAFRGLELAGEVGEACNVLKKLERMRIGLVGSTDTPEHLAEELADVVICADLIAMDVGIDLGDAIIAKFNATSKKNGLAARLPLLRRLASGGANG